MSIGTDEQVAPGAVEPAGRHVSPWLVVRVAVLVLMAAIAWTMHLRVVAPAPLSAPVFAPEPVDPLSGSATGFVVYSHLVR